MSSLLAVAKPTVFTHLGRRAGRWRRRLAGRPITSYLAYGALLLVVVVIVLSHLVDEDSITAPSSDVLTPPSAAHLAGTDEVGRDVLSRVLVGMSSSWWGAVAVIASGVIIGGLIGLIAGACGGVVDTVLMRATDAFLALPAAVLAVAVVASIGPSFSHTLIAVSLVWWPLYARIMRGEVTRLRTSIHVDAARIAGVGPVRRAIQYLLPGAVPPLIVAATLDVGSLILTLAGLSFLGLGAPPPAPELGSMSQQGLTYIFTGWWVPIVPAAAVALLVVIVNFAGDALRDELADR